MKRSIYLPLISLFCYVALLTSCAQNEEEIPLDQRTKEDTWYWGIFNGEIDGVKASLKNEDHSGPIRSGRLGRFYGITPVPDSINIMNTDIHYNNSSVLTVCLYDLTPGKRFLDLFYSESGYESYMKAKVYNAPAAVYNDPAGEKTKALYIPSKKNPFPVEITNVTWASCREPILEVKLDGILYNKEDPKDSIVIKGNYETR